MRMGDGYILVYDITSNSSFEDLTDKFYDQLVKNNEDKDLPIVLVGNKCDLEDNREVSEEEGKSQAEKMGNLCSYMEVSAKTGKNLGEVYKTLLGLIIYGEKSVLKLDLEKENTKSEKKTKGGLFSSLSNNDDVEIKLNKN
jgi:GTPase SAR1 family protein